MKLPSQLLKQSLSNQFLGADAVEVFVVSDWLPIIPLIIIKPIIAVNIQVAVEVLLASLSFFFLFLDVKYH